MIKNVKYRGMTTVPSDYECQDGELALGHNVAIDDSELRAVRLPSVVAAPEAGTDVMHVHQTDTYRHFIGKRQKSGLIDQIALSYSSGSLTAHCRYATESDITVSLYEVRRYVPLPLSNNENEISDTVVNKTRVTYRIPSGTTELVLEETVDPVATYELISFSPGADTLYTYDVQVASWPDNEIVSIWSEDERKITFHLRYPAASDVPVVVYYMARAYEHTIPQGSVEYTADQPNGVTRIILDGYSYADSTYNYVARPETVESVDDIEWLYDADRQWLCWFTSDDTEPVYVRSWLTGIRNVTSTGNILMAMTEESLEYFLWDTEKGEYKYLGKHLPEAKISLTSSMYFFDNGEVMDAFAGVVSARPVTAVDTSPWVDSGLATEDLPSSTDRTKWVTDGSADTSKKSSRLTTAAMGQLSKLLETARKEGLFVHPRLLRFAYRLYDGSYVQLSSPILIYNGSTREAVNGITGDAKICASVARYYLDYYIHNLDELKEWGEIIKGITFFLSSEIYDFDQNGRIDRLEYTGSIGSINGVFHAELPEIAEGTKAERVKDTYTFYKAYDIDLNDYHSGYALMYLDSTGLGGGSEDDMGKLNEGTLTVSIGIEGETRTATINVPEYSTLKYVEEQLTYAFHQWGVTAHVLHRNRANLPSRISAHKDPREIKCAIAFLSADKPTYWMGGRWDSTHNTLCYLGVHGGTVHGMPMLPDKLPLTTLETGFSVSDDYMSHNLIRPSVAYGYNSRQVFGNIGLYYYHPVFSGLYGYQKTSRLGNPPIGYSVLAMWFYLRVDGQEKVVRSDIQGETPVTYLNYPDTRCYKAVVKILDEHDDVLYVSLPMKSSDYLNGSLFLDSVPYLEMHHISSGIEWDGNISGADIASYADDSMHEDPQEDYGYEELPTTVMNSEVNNPFFFKASGFSSTGHTKILGLASATMAMSQGQFGQYPVYAFCEDGVFSLNVSSTGYFDSVTPTSRDVCISPESICQTDNAVIFATDRGVMVVSGSTVACMSEVLDGYNFDITLLPAYDELMWDAGLDANAFSLVDIREYVHGCFAMFDYTGQRMILANPLYPYCYLYSMKSKAWTTMDNLFGGRLNSYPETFAIDRRGRIVSISSPSADVAKGLVITRPLKLDDPDNYKTIYGARQRGTMASSSLSVALWGSNDMETWYLLRSSVSAVLRGFGGTPYKFHVMGVITDMDRKELLNSFSVTYSAKYTNKMR